VFLVYGGPGYNGSPDPQPGDPQLTSGLNFNPAEHSPGQGPAISKRFVQLVADAFNGGVVGAELLPYRGFLQIIHHLSRLIEYNGENYWIRTRQIADVFELKEI
jgi:hypothetical protein